MTKDAPAPPAQGRPRRRRTLRIVVLLLFLAAAVAAALVARSGWPEARLRALLEGRAAAAGYRLEMDALSVGYLPPALTVRGVRLTQSGRAEAAPLFEAERAEVVLNWKGLRAGSLNLRSVTLDGPVVRLPRPAATTGAGPGPSEGDGEPTPARPLRLVIAELGVRDGTVELPAGLWPVAGEAAGVRVDATRQDDGSMALEFAADPARLRLPSGGTWEARVAGSGVLEGTGFRFDRVRAEAPAGPLDVSGSVELAGPVAYRADGRLQLEGEALRGIWPGAPDLRGTVEAEGRLRGTGRVSRSEWTFAAEELSVDGVAVRGITGEMSHEGSALSVQGSAASFLGGSLRIGYLGAPHPDGGWKSDVDLATAGTSLSRLLRAAGEVGFPWSAGVDGEARASWRGADLDTLSWSSRLSLDPEAQPGDAPDLLRLGGSAELDYAGGLLTIHDTDLTAGRSRIRAEGSVSADGGQLEVALYTEEPDALQEGLLLPVVARLAPGSTLPEPGRVEGQLQLLGEIDFSAEGTRGRGVLEGEEVVWRDVPLGLLSAELELHPRSLDLRSVRVEGPAGHARAQGHWSFGGEGADEFSVDAAVSGVDLHPRVRALAGRELPVEGEAEGNVRLSGRGEVLDGRAELSVPHGSVLGMETTDLRLVTSFRPGGRASLEQAEAGFAGGRIRLSGGIELGAADELDLAIQGDGLSIVALLPEHELSRHLEGTLAVTGSVRGSMADPLLEARLVLSEPAEKPVRMGPLEAALHGDREALRVDVQARDLGLDITGEIGWNRWVPARFEIAARGLDVTLIPAVFGVSPEVIGLTGSADVSGTVLGPLRRPLDLHADLTIGNLKAAIEGHELQASATFPLGWEDGRLSVGPARLTGEGTDVIVEALVDSQERARTALDLRGRVDLALATLLSPKVRTSGAADVDLQILPGDETIRYEGKVDVRDGAISFDGLPFRMVGVEGSAAFDGPELTIRRMRGRMGGGAVEGSGFVRFDGVRPSAVRIQLVGDDVNVEYPAGLRSRGRFRLSLEDVPDGYRLAGDVTVERGVYRLRMETDNALVGREAVVSGAEVSLGGGTTGAGDRVALAMHISAPESLVVRNDQVRIVASAELDIGGTLATPQVSGTIQALDGGTINFRGVRYRVTGGWVEFAEYGRLDPQFHVEATTSVRSWDVHLEIDGGGGDELSYALSSYPPLSQEEILFLLISGRSPDELADEGGAFATEELAAYLAAPITDPLVQALGLTEVRLVPAGFNAAADPSARLTLVKDVHPDVRVTFSSDLSNAGTQVYLVEYAATPKIDVITSRDADGGVGADFHYLTRGYSYRRKDPDAGSRQAGRRIRSLQMPDTAPVDLRKLRRRLGLKEGALYRSAEASDAVDRVRALLQKQRFLEADASLEVTTEGDAVDLRLRLEPGARFEVRFAGVDKEKKLRRRLRRAYRESALPENVLDDALDEIETFYQERGYIRPQATYRMETAAGGAKVVTFDVVPGERVRVAAIEFVGNTVISDRRFSKVMLTRPRSAFGRGYLRSGVLEEDLRALRDLYLAEGYQQVEVGPAETEEIPGRRGVLLRVPIVEGPRWVVDAVRFEGNEGFSEAELSRAIELAPGEPVNRILLDAARTALKLHYDAAGYELVRVTYDLTGDGPAGQTVTFTIAEGSHHVVGPIRVAGNRHTRDRVIWRELEMDEGDPLSRESLLQAQRRLFRLGIFRDVSVRVGGQPGEEDRPVLVDVKEGPNLLTGFGLGWDTVGGARGFFQIRNGNLWGRNQTLGLVLRASRIDRRAQLNFVEPRLFGRRIEGLLSGTWSDEVRESFDVERLGITLQGSKKIGPYFYRAAYNVSDVQLSNVDLTPALVIGEITQSEKLEDVRLASISASMLRDLRDDPFNPQDGFYYSIDLGIFAEALGSERNFVKWYGQVTYQMPVTRRSVWAQSLRIGLLRPFGDTNVVPISEAFFAGGDSTLRGFSRDRAGPIDPNTGNPTGGNALLVMNQEYRFPILGPVRGVMFLDVGNVYRAINAGDVRWNAGLGIRYETPVGPLRLEYGWKLDRGPEESPGQLYFSIGLPF